MRAHVLCLALFAMTSAEFCFGQQATSELTADEIVARHEATWKKLERLSLLLEMRANLLSSVMHKDGELLSMRPYEMETSGRVYVDGEKSCFVSKQNKRGPESKEIRDGKYLISASAERVHIMPLTKVPGPVDKFIFGKCVAKGILVPQITLREWVNRAKPKLEASKNAVGEVICTLRGKLTTHIGRPNQGYDGTDEVIVKVNVDRGCFIERIEFACEKQDAKLAPKNCIWETQSWQDVADGVCFPARVRTEVSYWNLADKQTYDWRISEVKLSPQGLEKIFDYEIAENAVVFDETGHTGPEPVKIWGADGKPKKTYATEKEYYRELEAKNNSQVARELENQVSKMFEDCQATSTWDEKTRNFRTVVRASDGKTIHEFANTYEVALLHEIRNEMQICFAMIALAFVNARHVEKQLTIEEIVAQHEATWAKLERFSLKTEERAKVHCESMGEDKKGKPVYYTFFPTRTCESEIHCIGLRQFAKTNSKEEGDDRVRTEVWIRDRGLVTRSTQGRIEIWNEGNSSPKIPNAFGRTVDRTAPANTTLRKWVETARPELTTSKNDLGETLYHLRGKIEATLPERQYQVATQTDDLTVTINAAKGFLVEKLEYRSSTKGGLRDLCWKVQSWREAGDGLYFPAHFRSDYKGEGAVEDTWWDHKVVEFTLNSPNIEERFAYRMPIGAEVFDHDFKDHPGAAFISISGTDDKPARTFATYEEFDAYRDLEWEKLQAKGTQEWAATLFPNCKVTTTYMPETKSRRTIVTSTTGEVLHEFQSDDEIAYFQFIQELVIAALGGERQIR